ncbi:unnamed protein product [Meganyctiphanes norvegica]|uniref:Hcy-binding domain-containing protein n=1 Tax=Meganyctiphanes norvegica TaxID=48144 RepID=A0AAV2RW08_MEGNR
MGKKGILERLRAGVVVGDGSFCFVLEKRGYVLGGPYTPEAVVEHPEAVRQLHREYLRAGADVMQTNTFYSSDDKLNHRGREIGKTITCKDINNAASRLACEVAAEGDALVAGSVSQVPSYKEGKDKDHCQKEYAKQLITFTEHKVDFIICEFFQNCEEIEWAIEESKKSGLPVAASMCIGEKGDEKGTSLGECAVRMALAGADVVGLNCMFDPKMSLVNMRVMKAALDRVGLSPFLMTQPNCFWTTGCGEQGWVECPEYPFAMETRLLNRFDVQKYAREAYDLGVRYIGGCCGFEPYHVRAIAEELAKEHGGMLPPASEKHDIKALAFSANPYVNVRANKEYWQNIIPHSGRNQPPTYDITKKK